MINKSIVCTMTDTEIVLSLNHYFRNSFLRDTSIKHLRKCLVTRNIEKKRFPCVSMF